MMREISTLFLLFFAALLVAQSNPKIIVKGKKQGVKSSNTDEWLIPMGKQIILEPHENLFLKVDWKKQTVQGVYKDQYFHKTTETTTKLFFGDTYIIDDILCFQDGRVNVQDNSFTKPRFINIDQALCGPGAGFFEDHLIVAAATDSLGLYDLEVSKKKGVLKQYSNVEYRIVQNKLLVGVTEPITYDPTYDISYVVDQIDVYEMKNGTVKQIHSIPKEQHKKFDHYLNHLRGYTYEPLEEPKKVDYQVFSESNFKTDSAGKYPLILESGGGILLANRHETFFLTTEGEWLQVERTISHNTSEEGASSFFAIEERMGLEFISNFVYSRDYVVYDEYGEPLVNEKGYTVYQELEDIQNSGVWSWESNRWIVPGEYVDVTELNGMILAQKFLFSEDPEDAYSLVTTSIVDIYSPSGEMLRSMKEAKPEEIIKFVYSAEEVQHIPESYSLYEVRKGGKIAIVDFVIDVLSVYEVASFKDNYIPKTFNHQTQTYITQQEEEFFLNEYNVEEGVTTRLMEGKLSGMFLMFDPYGYEDLGFLNTDEANYFDLPYSGIYRLSDNQVVIYNNTKPVLYDYYNEYGETIFNVDEVGEILYGSYYDAKGGSHSGLWDLQEQKWLIDPNYYSIVVNTEGFAAIDKEDVVNGTFQKTEYGEEILISVDPTAVRDTFFLDLYDENFNIIEEHLDPFEFMEAPDNIKHFLSMPDLGKCVHHPVLVDSVNGFYDSYSYNWYEQGDKYAVITPNLFSFRPLVVAKDMDWLHQSNGHFYGLNGDSLEIIFEQGTRPSVKLMVGIEFELIESDQGVAVMSENLSRVVRYEEDEIVIIETVVDEFGEPTTRISKSAEEIYVHSIGDDLIYFVQMDTWDPYESFAKVRYRNDFIWKHDGKKWNIALSANNIEKTGFGYYVDSTFMIEGESDLDYVDPSFDLETMNGGAHFLNQDLQIIDLPVSSYYRYTKIDGQEDLYEVHYGENFRPELTGIISADGKIAVEACDYSIKGTTLEYSPCDLDGFGMIRFDENGEEVILTIELK